MEDVAVMAPNDEVLQALASEEAPFASERLWVYCEDENDETSFSLNIQLIETPNGREYKEPFFVFLDSFLINLLLLMLKRK